jgi:hypothetical protein
MSKQDHSVADNWFKVCLMLVAIVVLPGWWSVLPLVLLLTLD